VERVEWWEGEAVMFDRDRGTSWIVDFKRLVEGRYP
jgi:hypothetical protein